MKTVTTASLETLMKSAQKQAGPILAVPCLLVICARQLRRIAESCLLGMRRGAMSAWFIVAAWGFLLTSNLSAATVPPGFTEGAVPGPWSDAVGIAFEDNGRMYVWERTG